MQSIHITVVGGAASASATVLTAGFDPLRDGGAAYAEQLAADGVDVRRVNRGDMIHGFASMTADIDRACEAIAEVADDLGEAFGSA